MAALISPETTPSRFIPPIEVYGKGTSFVDALKGNAKDKNALEGLNKLNEEIKKSNIEAKFGENEGFIPVDDIVKNVEEYDRLQQKLVDNEEIDQEGVRSELHRLCQNWEALLKQKGLPESWKFTIPDLKEADGRRELNALYNNATQYIVKLGENVYDPTALEELAKINNLIKKDDDKIDIGKFQDCVKTRAGFNQTLVENPKDETTLRSYQDHIREFQKYVDGHNYPKDWGDWKINLDEIKKQHDDLFESLNDMYRQATDHMATLLNDPDNTDAKIFINHVNTNIANPKYFIPIDAILIKYIEGNDCRQKIQRDQNDQEARNKYESLRGYLDTIIKEGNFPNWNLPALDPPATVPPAIIPPSLSTNTTWRPGLTEEGYEILGMVPTWARNPLCRTADPVPLRCAFAVYKPNERNQLAYVDSSELGERATTGYLQQLDKAQRVDLSSKQNQYSHADRKGFVKILGFDCVSETNPDRYPNGLVLGLWEHGAKKCMNRSGWRDIWGERGGDLKIEDFHRVNDIEPKFSKRVQQNKESRGRSGSHSRSDSPNRPRAYVADTMNVELQHRLTRLEDTSRSFQDFMQKTDTRITDLQNDMNSKIETQNTILHQILAKLSSLNVS